MTYQEFIENFIKTDKTSMAYQQNGYFIRMVKVSLAKGVQAVYASYTALGQMSSKEYGFRKRDQMEVVGFIDCRGDFRFPTYTFLNHLVEGGNKFTEASRCVLANAIQVAVDKLAMKTPLPACSDEEFAYASACRELFCGSKACALKPEYDPVDMFSMYVEDDNILIDYLADTPGWAESAAKEWAGEFNRHKNGQELTNLDVLREHLALIEKEKEFMESIAADKSNKLHRYIAMKNAVKEKGAKTVTVEFKTATGEVATTKINASAFFKSQLIYIGYISLYDITRYRESDRVAKLLPKEKADNGREYLASRLSKDDIVAIKYDRKTIWSK